MIGFSPIVKKLWGLFFRRFLWNPNTKKYNEVIYVKSPLRALIKDGNNRFTLDVKKLLSIFKP